MLIKDLAEGTKSAGAYMWYLSVRTYKWILLMQGGKKINK